MAGTKKPPIGQRPEIAGLVPDGAKKILDVGCSTGDVGFLIKDRIKCEVFGIEIDSEKASQASSKLDKVITGDIEAMDPGLDKGYFDCIIFADVLEHLRAPLKTVKKYSYYLKDDGIFIISLPNVRHIKVLFDTIVLGEWKYEPFGIMDETHLRFFTLKSSRRMIEEAGLEPILKKRIFSLKGSRIINFLTLGIFKNFLTAQYVFVAAKKSMNKKPRRG